MNTSQPTDYLKSKGVDIFVKGHNSYKLEAGGFMTLTVESWPIGESVAVSMCHYGEQNGDLMKDPDILFHVGKDGVIEYKEYQNDYAGFYSENHAETKEFMEKTWIPNLISQGHKLTSSEIEEDD